MCRPLLALAAIAAALVTSSCVVRPTGDGGIAVAPLQDSPIGNQSVGNSARVTSPRAQPSPSGAMFPRYDCLWGMVSCPHYWAKV